MAKRAGTKRPARTTRAVQRKSRKHVYFFGGGRADGNRTMKDLLGGKGAGLAEMTNAGLPVPPGFTISTEACASTTRGKRFPRRSSARSMSTWRGSKRAAGLRFGSSDDPLLVSVRSGAKFSMPGMMDTILNLGLNDAAVEGLAVARTESAFRVRQLPPLHADVRQRGAGDPEGGIRARARSRQEGARRRRRTPDSTKARSVRSSQLTSSLSRSAPAAQFPQDPREQLKMAHRCGVPVVDEPSSEGYRRIYDIPDDIGTAVNVQRMVFGNTGDRSGTGVGFTRNPATGKKEFYGEFLINAQGEDVVAGIRTPQPISELEQVMPKRLQAASRHHDQAREALQRCSGFRVHHRGRAALHASDAQRQAHRLCRRRHRHAIWSAKS